MRRGALLAANQEALARLFAADPVLIDLLPAGQTVPGFTSRTILTSGPRLPWKRYVGGQREAIIGAALYERLAANPQDAEKRIVQGDIDIRGCQELGCVGSMAGIYTASMPVFVVKDSYTGRQAFCNLFEGKNPRRLNYGVYDDQVRAQLDRIRDDISPALGEAIRGTGGIPLKSIMTRALNMGDELHSRNTAAAMLLLQAISSSLLSIGRRIDARPALDAISEDPYSFLRLSMAASKVMADAAHNVRGSSLVTAMAFNCRQFAIRVSGLGDRWWTGSLPHVEARFFSGYSARDIAWMGGESPITETVGLGAFAQCAAFALQAYQGGSPQEMLRRQRRLYRIVAGEHQDFKIPVLGYRGTPVGIDICKVIRTGVRPTMNVGIAGKGGGQIGAGVIEAPLDCFSYALDAFEQEYDVIIAR
jgi:hypothetical protein